MCLAMYLRIHVLNTCLQTEEWHCSKQLQMHVFQLQYDFLHQSGCDRKLGEKYLPVNIIDASLVQDSIEVIHYKRNWSRF